MTGRYCFGVSAVAATRLVGIFDIIMGVITYIGFEYLCRRKGFAAYFGEEVMEVLYCFFITCSGVQYLMGSLLLAATLIENLFICKCYVYITAITCFTTVPFMLRIHQILVVNNYMETIVELPSCNQDRRNVNDIENCYNQIMEEQQPPSIFFQNTVSISNHWTPNTTQPRADDVVHSALLNLDLQRFWYERLIQQLLSSDMHVDHPLQDEASDLINNAPPAYAICVSQFGLRGENGSEKPPPTYEAAIEMSEWY